MSAAPRDADPPAPHPTPPSGALPTELTRFIGRDREVEELERLLTDARLLTLTGAGGSGKTRLALELLQRRDEAARGRVIWVELATLGDPALVPRRILEALGPREEFRGEGADAIRRLAGSDPLLIVLDNCEHVVEACASLVDALLRSTPNLQVLATSREALGVRGERAWLVPPLTLPVLEAPASRLAESEAVQLFVDRARDTVADFELTQRNAAAVAEICRRLDGMPLAIELAAARVRVLPPEEIRNRLDDVFRLLTSGGRTSVPRHRTLRAAIEWSHDLLLPEGRVLLRRLSVFRGGFALDGAEALGATRAGDFPRSAPEGEATGTGPSGDPSAPAPEALLDEAAILDAVARLVDRSLVQVREFNGTARYALLETIRQYALARLVEAGEEGWVRESHARFMAAEAARARPHLVRPDRGVWVERLLLDLENLRDALVWSREHDGGLHLELVGDLWWFWYSTRHWREAGRWIRDALALPEAAAPGRERAMLLFAAGALATLQGRFDEGRGPLEEAVRIAASIGDGPLEAYALNYLGLGFAQRRDPAFREPVERALAWFRAQDDPFGLRLALLLSALGAQFAGDSATADHLSREAIDVARAAGPDRELAIALQSWALVRGQRGEVEEAQALVIESLGALREDPSHLFLARGFEFLAETAARLDTSEDTRARAAGLLAVARTLRESIGAEPFEIDRERVDKLEAELRGRLGAASFREAWERGRSRRWEEVADELTSPGLPRGPDHVSGGAPLPVPASDRIPGRSPLEEGTPTPAPASSPPATSASSAAAPAGGVPVAAGLRVRMFGSFAVELDGTPLDPEAWSYTRPRELLLYLLLHPRGATRDEIGRALWPDATPPQVRNSFHVALHHLRKRLGEGEWIALEGARCRLSPDRTVSWDGADFEAGVRPFLDRTSPEDVELQRLRATLDLYRGDLLDGGGTGRWLEEARDHFRRLYTDARLVLAGALEARGEWDAAGEEYLAVTRTEELNEEAHRGLMRCWGRAGYRDRAVRHFERLEVLLRDALEAEPEPATRALAEEIRGRVAPEAPGQLHLTSMSRTSKTRT